MGSTASKPSSVIPVAHAAVTLDEKRPYQVDESTFEVGASLTSDALSKWSKDFEQVSPFRRAPYIFMLTPGPHTEPFPLGALARRSAGVSCCSVSAYQR